VACKRQKDSSTQDTTHRNPQNTSLRVDAHTGHGVAWLKRLDAGSTITLACYADGLRMHTCNMEEFQGHTCTNAVDLRRRLSTGPAGHIRFAAQPVRSGISPLARTNSRVCALLAGSMTVQSSKAWNRHKLNMYNTATQANSRNTTLCSIGPRRRLSTGPAGHIRFAAQPVRSGISPLARTNSRVCALLAGSMTVQSSRVWNQHNSQHKYE
jgi:hypothetical protein